MASSWSPVLETLEDLRDHNKLDSSLLKRHLPDLQTLFEYSSQPNFPSNGPASLPDVLCAAASGVVQYLGTSNVMADKIDDATGQAVALVLMVARKYFACVLENMLTSVLVSGPSVMTGYVQRLITWDIYTPWGSAALKLAAALRHQHQKKWQPSVLPTMQVASALLDFWFPVIGFFKNPKYVGSKCSVMTDTVQAAAQLAAGMLHTWPGPVATSSSRPATAAAAINADKYCAAMKKAFRAGDFLGAVLRDAAGNGVAAEPYVTQLAQDDATLHVVCCYLAYATIAMHDRRQGALQVPLASSGGKRSARVARQHKAVKVPAHHSKLLTALGLEGWTQASALINEDAAYTAVEDAASCLSGVLAQRQKLLPGAATTAVVVRMSTPLMLVCVELLLLLGPSSRLQSALAVVDLMRRLVMIMQIESQTAVATKAARELELPLLLQAGPAVFAALQQTATDEFKPAHPAAAMQGLKLVMEGYGLMLASFCGTGRTDAPLTAAMKLAPLTSSAVLEAVARACRACQSWRLFLAKAAALVAKQHFTALLLARRQHGQDTRLFA